MTLLDLKIGDVVPYEPVFRPAPIPAFAQLHWRIAIITRGREKTTVARLVDLKLGLKPYLPLEHKFVAAGRHRKREAEPAIFPGYLFIPMPDLDEIWHEVLSVPGVQGFLTITSRFPKMLPPAEINRVRTKELELNAKHLQRLAAAGKYPFPVGDPVWVKDMLPFQALLGSVAEYDRRGRAGVVLDREVLGRKFFWIEPHHLEAV